MEFLDYYEGKMKTGIWYFNKNNDKYEKYGDDTHRATIDKDFNCVVYCDNDSYEMTVALYNGKDLKTSIEWVEEELRRRCNNT